MFIIYVENVYAPEGIVSANISECERILFTASASGDNADTEETAGTVAMYPGAMPIYRGEDALTRFNDIFDAFGSGQTVYDTREDIGYWHNHGSASGASESTEEAATPKRRGRPPKSESKEPATPPPSE